MTHTSYPHTRKSAGRPRIDWTDSLKQRVIDLYNSGLNCGRVGAIIGISETSVQGFITLERTNGTALRVAPHGRKS